MNIRGRQLLDEIGDARVYQGFDLDIVNEGEGEVKNVNG